MCSCTTLPFTPPCPAHWLARASARRSGRSGALGCSWCWGPTVCGTCGRGTRRVGRVYLCMSRSAVSHVLPDVQAAPAFRSSYRPTMPCTARPSIATLYSLVLSPCLSCPRSLSRPLLQHPVPSHPIPSPQSRRPRPLPRRPLLRRHLPVSAPPPHRAHHPSPAHHHLLPLPHRPPLQPQPSRPTPGHHRRRCTSLVRPPHPRPLLIQPPLSSCRTPQLPQFRSWSCCQANTRVAPQLLRAYNRTGSGPLGGFGSWITVPGPGL